MDYDDGDNKNGNDDDRIISLFSNPMIVGVEINGEIQYNMDVVINGCTNYTQSSSNKHHIPNIILNNNNSNNNNNN